MEKTNETLLLTLARKLMEKQVRAEVICQSLEMICGRFSFDNGMLYETDHFNMFHLKEQYTSCERKLPECFNTDRFESEFVGLLAEEPLLHVQKHAQNTPNERTLLELFPAQELVVFFFVDENCKAVGMIVFESGLNTLISEQEVSFLSTLLSLLGRYVEIRIYQSKLSFMRNSLENILDNSGIDIYVNDFNTHEILYANKSMAAPYGGIPAFIGKKCWEVLYPGQNGPCSFCPQQKLLDEEGEPTKMHSWNYQRPFDKAWFRVFSAAFRWVDGRLVHVVSSADITENKRNEELIEYLANYDSLTELPNRRMLVMECEKRINRATEAEKGYLLFFDIDGFKSINDTYGHDAGDEFLIKLGRFFSEIPLLKDAIYRNGGDEFVAVIGGENMGKQQVRDLISMIHERFQAPWELKNGNVLCNTSVGVASYPEDGRTAEALLQIADQAMYQAKKGGPGRVCFGFEFTGKSSL